MFVAFLPYPNTIFHKMTSNKKLLKHIRTTNALSSIPPVLDILDRNDTSKLIVKYTYEIPVVLLRISDLGSAQGIIVFTDFSEIKTNTCMKYGRVPYSIAKEDYSVGGVIIPKDRLFNSSIRRDQYDTLAKMIERSVQGDPEDDGFLIAKLNFDLKIKNCKYLEGYFNHAEIATKKNLHDLFEKDLQYEFLEMLRRMKGFCEPDVYNELRVKYDFSSFEIFRKNRNRGDIELDSQLPDQKRRNFGGGIAANMLSNKIVKDSQRMDFDTQATQIHKTDFLQGPIIEEEVSNQPLNLDSQLPTVTNAVPPDPTDSYVSNAFEALNNTSSRQTGSNLLFHRPVSTRSSTTNQNTSNEGKSKGISQMVIPCTPIQSSNETNLEAPSFASVDTAAMSQDLGSQLEMVEPKIEPSNGLNLTSITVLPDWDNVTKKYLDRHENAKIRIKSIYAARNKMKSFQENVPYTLEKIKVKGMFPFHPIIIKPYARTWKITPFKIIAEDVEDKNLTLAIEISNDDEICKFFNINEIEDVVRKGQRINSQLQRLLNQKKEVLLNIKRKIRTLPNNFKYTYWTIDSPINQII